MLRPFIVKVSVLGYFPLLLAYIVILILIMTHTILMTHTTLVVSL